MGGRAVLAEGYGGSLEGNMTFNRAFSLPDSQTFRVGPIREFVMRHLAGSWSSIDPYSRDCQLAGFTNDLNPATKATHHMYAVDFLRKLVDDGVQADLVIMDPPYSPRQVKECYEGIGIKVTQQHCQQARDRALMRPMINKLLTPAGKVLWFGWNSNGMGKQYGFKIDEVLLVSHGAMHNDTICIAESRENGPINISRCDTTLCP